MSQTHTPANALEDIFLQSISAHNAVMRQVETLEGLVQSAVDTCVDIIRNDGKLLICGNGGSAADSQHFAAEIVGRFRKERRPWPAVALTTDSSILTAVGNDYGFDEIFARQVEGIGRPGDALIGISTSGNSPNIQNAVQTARKMGIFTIGLLGRNGGAVAKEMDLPLIVKTQDTARIQEAHIFLIHYIAGGIEVRLLEQA
jgi:D-sedoheptulose 7-phosphate isomerase